MNAEEYNEAVEVLVRLIKPNRERLTTQASRANQVEVVGHAILRGTYPLGAAVDGAIAGDPYLDRALREIAGKCLSEGVLSDDLARFVIHILGASGPANFPKGQHSLNFWGRDAVIRMLVEETIQQWKVSASRNAANYDSPSASTIVAAALARCGIEIGENQVAEIYRRPARPK